MKKRKVYYPELMRKPHKLSLSKHEFPNDQAVLNGIHMVVTRSERITDADDNYGWNLYGTRADGNPCDPKLTEFIMFWGFAIINGRKINVYEWNLREGELWVRGTTGNYKRGSKVHGHWFHTPSSGGRVPADRHINGDMVNTVLLPLFNKHRVKPNVVDRRLEDGGFITIYLDGSPTSEEAQVIFDQASCDFGTGRIREAKLAPTLISERAGLVRMQVVYH